MPRQRTASGGKTIGLTSGQSNLAKATSNPLSLAVRNGDHLHLTQCALALAGSDSDRWLRENSGHPCRSVVLYIWMIGIFVAISVPGILP